MNINICTHDDTSETHEGGTGGERCSVSTKVAASSQLFCSLATLVTMKARPRLAEDKLDELVELFSEGIEGIRAEVTRYGTKETKYKKRSFWAFSFIMRT